MATRAVPRCGRGGLALLACALAGFAALLPALLQGFSRASGGPALLWVGFAIYALTFLLALLVGAVFPLASRADAEEASARGEDQGPPA